VDVLHFGMTYLVQELVEDLVCLEVRMVGRMVGHHGLPSTQSIFFQEEQLSQHLHERF
jgi:hypothetical protein